MAAAKAGATAAAACCCAASAAPRKATRGSSGLLALASLTTSLLASGCCIVQLAANALSLGCAGFAALEPLRAPMRAASFGILGVLLFKKGITRSTLLTLALSLALMGSQEAVRLYNTSGFSLTQALRARLPPREPPPRPPLHGPSPSAESSVQGEASKAGAAAADHQDSLATLLHFRVSGIKCEGCAAHLKGKLQALQGVERATVSFAAGEVWVWVRRPWSRVGDADSDSDSDSGEGAAGAGGSEADMVSAVRSTIQMTDLSYVVTLLQADV